MFEMFHTLRGISIKIYIVTEFCYGSQENDRNPSLIPHKISLLNHHFSPHLVHANSKRLYFISDLSELRMTSCHQETLLSQLLLVFYSVQKSCPHLMIFLFLSIEKNITPCCYGAPFVSPNLLFVGFCRNSPQWARASSFTRFLDHTQRRTTVGRTPLDE